MKQKQELDERWRLDNKKISNISVTKVRKRRRVSLTEQGTLSSWLLLITVKSTEVNLRYLMTL